MNDQPVAITYRNDKEDRLRCTLYLPGGDPDYDNIYNFNDRLLDGIVECRLEMCHGEKKKTLLQLLEKSQILRTHQGVFIIRRTIAENIFENSLPSELTLRPTVVTIKGEIVDRAWVFLELLFNMLATQQFLSNEATKYIEIF